MIEMRLRPRVLVIDDQEISAGLACDMLSAEPDISIEALYESSLSLEKVRDFSPSVILVDVCMPGVDGFAVIARLRKSAEGAAIPIILLSSEDAPERKAQGFAAGANDYLVKWPARAELVARVRYHSDAHYARVERDAAYASLQSSQAQLLQRTRQLELSQAALHQAQKLEAIGQLTGGVAHDFNNVLQIISGNLHLLREGAVDSAGARRIDAAMSAVQRGASLASQLLAFARQQPLQPLVVKLDGMIRNMHQMVHRTLGDDIEVSTVVDDDLWNSLVDPSQFETVILNLVINARDAMDGHGRLTLQATNVVLDNAYVDAHPEVKPGEYVRIAVSDTGCGMTPELIDRVFEPFFTTKRPGRGTGLGLSMAYGFVQQSGGHIDIESRVDAGTTVTVYLPRCTGEVEPMPDMHAGRVLGGEESILVVEDDHALRDTVVAMLTGLGYRVAQAHDALSALRLLEGGRRYDLLFSDVVMPGPMHATELAERAKALLPDIEVLYTSGYAEHAITHGGRLDPGVSLLSKPYRHEQLARKLRQLLDARAERLAERSADGKTPRVLMVEDNADLLDLTMMMLAELGHEGVGVGSAEEALAMLERERFGMLMTDITLPKMSGIELARRVRTRHPAMPIVVASGYGRSNELDGLDVAYLKKPFQLAELEGVVAAGFRNVSA
ncbi:response regulator [Noviherbaspirillum pedocola]|uniref:histidine kinase n=1 Tax=Noviherbaspirillum pedocola TaxID=2801341 RepID=A0A934SNL7_9BURK|nr:response regulator [Noviherbaspirillum pedocola]MBK4733755.1 response regulator [Noviherbaspirillum pedocola]